MHVSVLGKGTVDSALIGALQAVGSSSHKDVQAAIAPLGRPDVFIVIGNKCTVHKRMVESWNDWVERRISHAFFVCKTHKEAWFVENRKKLGGQKISASTGNRADVRDFFDRIEENKWFDLPKTVLILETDEARQAYKTFHPEVA